MKVAVAGIQLAIANGKLSDVSLRIDRLSELPLKEQKAGFQEIVQKLSNLNGKQE